MRLPNLNWPANLFTDVPDPDLVATPLAPTAIEPSFWSEMADSWVGRGLRREFPWCAPSLESEQHAW